MFRRLLAAICLVCLAMMPICSNNPIFPAAQAAAKVKLSQTNIGLVPGETFRLKVSGTTKKVTWCSSNKKVAKVSKKGLVTALKKGTAKITAKVGKKKLTCKVTVFETTPPPLVVVKKPVIYLYPETETELTVRLGRPEDITASYPAYGDGWRVSARPDGALEDLNSGRRLYALYWEGVIEAASGMSDGFVVPGADTAAFLEDKLARLGLTEREAEEFIVYWMPLLQENPYNLIRFEDSRAIDEAMPLLFSVEPDTLIRVWMVYQPLEAPVEVPEQVLPEAPVRRGFTAVEWGGRLSAAP